MEQAGPPCVGPTPDLYLCFIFKGNAPMIGTLPVHLVGILGCGELGDMKKPRQSLLPPVVLKPCQGKLGEVCWRAMVLRPVLCARGARKASWKQSTQLKYASSLVWDDPQGKPRLWNLSYHFPVMMWPFKKISRKENEFVPTHACFFVFFTPFTGNNLRHPLLLYLGWQWETNKIKWLRRNARNRFWKF